MLSGHSYNYSVDVWSLGIVTFELLYGYSPFNGKNESETIRNILNNKSDALSLAGDIHMSAELKDFIYKVLNKNANKRIIIEDVVTHEWLIKYNNKSN